MNSFYILSIDGGGFRGVFAAHVLKRMEDEFRLDWRKKFGLFAGTSTGAIIAAGLACGLSAEHILNMYKKYGPSIFKKRLLNRHGIFGSRYKNKGLKSVLEETFKGTTLGDISIPLILPATNISNGRFHVFKSKYHPDFVRDPRIMIKDAILASCSAPTYFDPHIVDKYVLADGGLWANNPALVAAIEAKYRLKQDLDKLKVLSIGTGVTNQFYSQSLRRWKNLFGWGFLTRWWHRKFINMLFNLQTEVADNMLKLLLDPEQILGINFSSDSMALDDTRDIDTLISAADAFFAHHYDQIGNFLFRSGSWREN